LFLKNDKVVESISKINCVVFDKTGTLTDVEKGELVFTGKELSYEEKKLIKSAVRNSTHPYSKSVFKFLGTEDFYECDYFKETTGKGIEASIKGNLVKIGNSKWFFSGNDEKNETSVYASINGEISASFEIKSKYREGIFELIEKISQENKIVILSGDNESEQALLEEKIPKNAEFYFRQLPIDKLNFIEKLQNNGDKVLMIGDGLNDAGALAQSDVGIALTDNTANFTPGSDAILSSENILLLPKFLKLAKKSLSTVYLSFILSIFYNLVGFSFAVTGYLSPVLAAILMPLSSINVVLFTVLTVSYKAKRMKLI
jgi:P-type Cu+ transporter